MTAVALPARRPRPHAPDRPGRLAVVAMAVMAAAGCAEVDGLAASVERALAPAPALAATSADADAPGGQGALAVALDAPAEPAALAPVPAPTPGPTPALAPVPAPTPGSTQGLAPGPLRGGPEAARGSALLAAGHAEAAGRAFSVSLATEGASAQALVGLGAANRALGRTVAARDLLERAVALWPQDVSARNGFGAVLYDDAQFAAARAQFQAALALLPPQDAAARLEVTRNIAFTDAALERGRVARDARDAAAEPASGPIVRPLGGGRWRIDPPKGT